MTAALLGAVVGLSLYLVVAGLVPRERSLERRPPSLAALRLIRAVGVGLVAWVVTGWPVAGVALAGAGWAGAAPWGGRRARREVVARIEAVASWAEMLRDTMAAAHGLEEAIAATAPIAPRPIAPEVTRLALAIERAPLAEALVRFGAELADRTGDLIVVALRQAATGDVRDLGRLLGALAGVAREEAAMRMRVEAARARTRTSVRVIAGCTVGFAVALVFTNRAYFAPYDTGAGQVALAMVALGWAGGLAWLASMARYRSPDRLLAQTPGGP